MRKFFATLFGALSTSMGFLVVAPKLNDFLWIPQLLLNEFSWIPTVFGVVGMILSVVRKPRHYWALVLSVLGISFSTKPFWWIPRTIADQKQSMRRGIGADYESKIPPVMFTRMATSYWSLSNTFGGRERNAKVHVSSDITYSMPGNRPLKLDVYHPKVAPAVGDRYPAIVCVHGGSWASGDKNDAFTVHHRYLASQGYVVFAVQYRLSGEAIWPAQMEDVQCAVRWVKHHADQYDVDAQRVALFGRSAGGHIALMAAYRACDPAVKKTCLPDVDANVQSVVAIYPPTDLRLWRSVSWSAVTALMGGLTHEKPQAYADASPVEFVRDGLPPTLLVQGYMDELVFPAHAESLKNRLWCTDTPVVMLRSPWSRHGFDGSLSGLGAQIAQYSIDRFLAWSLYGESRHE
ncbi:MAG: alpha/beta hydrolase [Chloroflexi bacterium]|nr:MAG: alpha/beta hydrolase [Chloroflexota bacterium]